MCVREYFRSAFDECAGCVGVPFSYIWQTAPTQPGTGHVSFFGLSRIDIENQRHALCPALMLVSTPGAFSNSVSRALGCLRFQSNFTLVIGYPLTSTTTPRVIARGEECSRLAV